GAGSDAEIGLAFRDDDGLMLELVGHPAAEARTAWGHAPGIPREHAIRGFHGVTLWLDARQPTEQVLVETLGFRPVSEEGTVRRYTVGGGGFVELREIGGFGLGASGGGTVHHVAFALPDDESELELREQVSAAGLQPTPVIDRYYFRSVYF